jgi:hypothetical protein
MNDILHNRLHELHQSFDRDEAIRVLTSIDMKGQQLMVGRRNTQSYDEIRKEFEGMTDGQLKFDIAQRLDYCEEDCN